MLFAVPLTTDDGLELTLDDATGAVTELRVDSVSLPLLSSSAPLTVQVGDPGIPATLQSLSFESADGPWVSASGADWDDAGDYATWLPSGGVNDSGHLLLGNGSAVGVGMALDAPFPVCGDAQLTISHQARSASTETLQIVGVRVFDAEGTDITSSVTPPSGWIFSSVSQAHVVFGIGNSAPDTWEPFTFTYNVPAEAASAIVSVRHWNSGDHLVHIDNLTIEQTGGIVWNDPEPLMAAPITDGDGVTMSGLLADDSLSVTATVQPSGEVLAMRLTLQSLPPSHTDRAALLRWALPIDLEGWTWWDDLDVSETLTGDTVAANTFTLSQHDISWHPLAAVASGELGLSLAVPMEEAVAQRFEASATGGLSSVWEIGLSPLTQHLGPSHAEVSLLLTRCDGDWGFRSALERFQARFPEHFAKRTVREGAWEYPIPVTAIASPEDFGFAHYEHWELNWQLQPHEREALRQANIATHFYVEPWVVWDSWFDGPEQPSPETLQARAELWAENPGAFATWWPDGGLSDTGHLQIGDGCLSGSGMATAERYPVTEGRTLTLGWQARTANVDTAQILGIRLCDAAGLDVTSSLPAPSGWFFSTASQAHVVAALVNTQPDTWETFEQTYVVPSGAVEARFSLRHWTGGDHTVHIDDFTVDVSGEATPLLLWDFNSDTALWTQALNSDWDTGGARWILAPRQEMAQAVIESSPHTASGVLALVDHPGLWRPNDAGTGGSQLWPLNLDPDLPDPSGFSVFHDHWITPSLASDDGIYVDSMAVTWGFGNWLNHRPEHLAVVDHPLTFDWRDGHAAQIGFQSQVEFLQATTPMLRGLGHLVMVNLFPEGHRFAAPWADLMGSEITQFTEPQGLSRVRRAMAGTRIVSNLLQRFQVSDEYATHEEMAEFFRSHLFWGFHPAVSSIGKTVGGAPDRYFLHPELYERDRDLFQTFMPVIRELGEAGWQPIPHAQGEGLEVERFGAFDQGHACFTVRAADGQATETPLMVDLEGMGLDPTLSTVSLWNVLSDTAQPFTLVSDGRWLETEISLGADEVRVLRLTVESPSGLSGR